MEEYGPEKALGILASTRIIMMGNAYGIAYGCLKSRLKGNPVDGSSITNELGILLGSMVMMPVALISGVFHSKKNQKK